MRDSGAWEPLVIFVQYYYLSYSSGPTGVRVDSFHCIFNITFCLLFSFLELEPDYDDHEPPVEVEVAVGGGGDTPRRKPARLDPIEAPPPPPSYKEAVHHYPPEGPR